MRQQLRPTRLATMLIAVAVYAVIFGLGVQFYRAWSPVRRYIRESRPGNPQFTRLEAVTNLTYGVPQVELEEAFPVLLAAAKDKDPMIRAAAVTALQGRRDHFAEVLAILRGLVKDPDPRVREAAIFHLETFVKPGSPEVVTLLPDLLATLEDPKPAVRLEACRALYVYGQLPRAVPALARLVREEEGNHRLGALGFLMAGKTIPKDLEPTLRTMLKSEYVWERIWTGQALIQLGIPEQERDAIIRAMLESSMSAERLAAANLWIHVGKPENAIPALKDLADRGDRDDRIMAADSLIKLGKPEMAIPALKEMADRGDESMRARAERLLKGLEDGEETP
jgi:HEAT repeat protein